MSGHATTVIISVDGLGRHSSSCDRVFEFLTEKSSSEWPDAWSSGVASCIAVKHRLMKLKPFLNKNRNIVDGYGYGCCPGPISPSMLSTLLFTCTSAIITKESKLIVLNRERGYPRDWTILINLVLLNEWAPLWSSSALDQRSLPPEFEYRGGHIWRVFHFWLRLITFGCRSAHLA